MDSRVIEVTAAAHRHGNLNIRSCGEDFFPKGIFGPASRREGVHDQIVLKVDGFPDPILTDIPRDKDSQRPRWILRERSWFKAFVRQHRLSPGDAVTMFRIDEHNYFLTPTTQTQTTHLFERNLPPTLYAHHLASQYLASTSVNYRKQKGQYFTPPEIASFMAKLADSTSTHTTRILDPGAGTGILACAVCELIVSKSHAKRIHIDAYENDSALLKLLYRSLLHASRWAQERGVRLTFDVLDTDFVLSACRLAARSKFHPYDVIISNPPYLKISAADPRSMAMPEIVHGQPNIYALFMAACVPLVKPTGSFVYITPRSFTSGHYFKAFRRFFFASLQPVRVHLFESRKDIFSNQSVLQENVIIQATRNKFTDRVVVSHSTNSDNLNRPAENSVPLQYALHPNGNDTILRLPLDEFDDLIIEIVDSWADRLASYGLEISTGPVVPFRAKRYLFTEADADSQFLAPLLWMCNVHPMRVTWPSSGLKGRDSAHQFILNDAQTQTKHLLVPNKTIILLRRFSAKEEKRRLVAAPMLCGQLNFEFLGIENHLNYIYRPRGVLSPDEARGLAALLNSFLIDRYFRICNGNTQVGATELRTIPLPPIELIRNLGRNIYHAHPTPTLKHIDIAVINLVRSSAKKKHLLQELQK
jgi:adenine-specific DNA-methyltransferase